MLLASAVSVVHALVVAFMLTGALLALRRPRLVRVHAPLAGAVLAVNLAGMPCPLTELELALRAEAGAAPFSGGWLGHYVFSPVGLGVHSPAVQLGTYTVALGANAVGYVLLARRAARRRVAQPRGGPRSAWASRRAGRWPSLLKSAGTWRPSPRHSPIRSAHQRRSVAR